MQLRKEIGIGGGSGDSMDRQKIKKRKTEVGREGKPWEERVPPKWGRMERSCRAAGALLLASSIH